MVIPSRKIVHDMKRRLACIAILPLLVGPDLTECLMKFRQSVVILHLHNGAIVRDVKDELACIALPLDTEMKETGEISTRRRSMICQLKHHHRMKSVYVAIQVVLSPYASGRPTGSETDSGDGVSFTLGVISPSN